MREVLHELHQHRSLTSLDIEKAFDTQQVRPTQLHQRIHGPCKYRPWHRRFFGQDKTADTVTVGGLRNEWVALVGGRFGGGPFRNPMYSNLFGEPAPGLMMTLFVALVVSAAATCVGVAVGFACR